MSSGHQLPIVRSHIRRMTPLPATATKVLEICGNVNTSPADLNKIISLDPVLTGKVLKLINSAYYGLHQEVTSLVRAIIMLGLNTVKNMVLSTAVLSTMGNRQNFPALDMNGFWLHSLSVGVLSKLLAVKRRINRDRLEEYFIAGLLHDIGKIPLNYKLAEAYLTALKAAESGPHSLFVAEENCLEITHTHAGQMIMDNWQLGPEIADAVACHHRPEEYQGEHADAVYTVALADYFANTVGIGFSGNHFPDKIESTVLRKLNIAIADMEDIVQSVNEEIAKAKVFLSISR